MALTACIAAACDNGELVVTATDGLPSSEDVAGEVAPAGKMLWFGPWHFMYAGIPGNFAMIQEEIDGALLDDPGALSRRNVIKTVRSAYRLVSSRFSSRQWLDPFDMTMDDFKETGRKAFGDAYHDEMSRQITQKSQFFNEQMIVTGWGHAPRSVMIYEISQTDEMNHGAAGFAAIGSGSQMATTMLLLLGQARHRTLAETIFNVACAKFSSEKTAGMSAGMTTSMCVSRKHPNNPKEMHSTFILDGDLKQLRALWDAHLRPRIPEDAGGVISGISARTMGKLRRAAWSRASKRVD